MCLRPEHPSKLEKTEVLQDYKKIIGRLVLLSSNTEVDWKSLQKLTRTYGKLRNTHDRAYGTQLIDMSDQMEKKPPPAMYGLPTELQQQILTQLSPQDLARLRSTSKVYRTTVQLNLNYVSKQLYLPDLRRLQNYVKYHFDCKIDFLESLRRFYSHRRYGPPYPGSTTFAADFATLWIYQHHGIDVSANLHWSRMGGYGGPFDHNEHAPGSDVIMSTWAVERLANLMLKIHTQYHAGPSLWGLWPYGASSHLPLTDPGLLSYLQASGTNTYGITTTELQRWETSLLLHGLGTHQRDARQGCDEDGIPKYPLTPLEVDWIVKRRPSWTGSKSYVRIERSQRLEGLCAVSKIVEVLGLPVLPENGLFAYCVQSSWALEKVREGVEGIQELDRLVKAMILREVFVF